MYFYVKALHIIFIATWFAGMFYIVRLFIYNTEAAEKEGIEREILVKQFSIMIKRLWLGITWPSAILTIIFGGWIAYIFGSIPSWLWVKLGFVAGLYAVFLIAIVMIVTVKDSMSWIWGVIGLILFTILLMSAIKVYKLIRNKKVGS